MLRFPLKKCYHTAKICLLLILVVALLSLFEHWRGGKRTAKAQFFDPAEEQYELEILKDEARIIPGLGEGGVAAQLVGEDKRLGEESEKKLAMNVYLSDRIAYNRTLKDHRNPACQRVVYDAELPSASVVIIFHNEPYSVVVRTIWSVINSARRDNPWHKQANFVDMQTGKTMNLGYKGQDPSSPLVYLKEIILVDDNSTLPELKGKLSYYIRTRLPPDLVRILRLPDRIGLTQARQMGARTANGQVLIFLDAHCEVVVDWLRPILQRIKDKKTAVVTPLIDMIEQDSFEYSPGWSVIQFEVGGFTFMGHFTWIDVPEREKKRRGSNISPTWSPTMAGGLFAISREYYWELGAYDEQMAGWGGENLEMSFRIWQCGGTLETVPCSRVGHVFRSFHPYGLPAHTDTHGINTARMAEVWMDEYAELFYIHRPDLRKSQKIGDVTHRKVLREKLHCKSFQWYLDNIYPEKFVPVRDVYGYGRFSNPSSGMCLDTLQRSGAGVALGVYPCHSQLLATQYFSLSLAGQLRDEEMCAELQYGNKESESTGRPVVMANCRDTAVSRKQKWSYRQGRLTHEESGLCLTAGRETGADVAADDCGDHPTQKWTIDYSEDNGFKAKNDEEPSEQEQRLLKLRGQRRVSRSLLSYSPPVRKRPNKFIVRLTRTLPSGSEDHLEVDIHCKHRRLYPNNTFVRDLVSILNDNNIKVINKGRVFEKNKVYKYRPATRPSPSPSPSPAPSPRAEDTDHSAQVTPLSPRGSKIDRIIIEDFVTGMADDEVTKQSKKKHKHKSHHKSSMQVLPLTFLSKPSPPPSPSPTPSPEARDIIADKHTRNDRFVSRPSSGGDTELTDAEDQPLLLEAEDRDGSEDWTPNDGRNKMRITPLRRTNCEHSPTNEHCGEHEQTRKRTDTQDDVQHSTLQKHKVHPVRPHHLSESSGTETESEAPERTNVVTKKPVQVLMKSNMTFDFRDEFFDWKKDTVNDITNILNESAISSRNTSPVELQAWIKHSKNRDQDRDQDQDQDQDHGDKLAQVNEDKKSSDEFISTGRGVIHPDSHEDHSSLDSGD